MHVEAIQAEGRIILRMMEGEQVWEEQFSHGRLFTRYRNCLGQVWPENHFHHLGPSVAPSFDISWLTPLEGAYRWEGLHQPSADSASIQLSHESGAFQMEIVTQSFPEGIFRRSLRVTNTSPSLLPLRGFFPLTGDIWRYHGVDLREYLPEGAPPFVAETCHASEWLQEGDYYADALGPEGLSLGSARGKSGYGRPAARLQNRLSGETFVIELAYSGNWQMALLPREAPEPALSASVGTQAPEGEALYVLAPGETLASPDVYTGLFRATHDEVTQTLHRFVRRHILLPLPERTPVAEIEANHRGYLCDRETTAGIIADAELAADVGVEMYVVDAGWYGHSPNQWYHNVGDWFEGAWMEGDGLRAVSRRAHALGMRFGLWMEIEAAGAFTDLRREHPDWIVTRYGEPCADGRALDLSNPEVESWAYAQIASTVKAYDLDMYRIDHNHDIGPGGTRQVGSYIENTLYRYYMAFYRIFGRLHATFPSLVLQNCASGGGRLDWGCMRYFHNVELSDYMRSPRSVRIINGVTQALPPEILLRAYGTEGTQPGLDGDIAMQLAAAFLVRPILRGIAPRPALLTPKLAESIKRHVAFYTRRLRPLFEKGALVFHHTPLLPSLTASPWICLEYASPDGEESVIGLFAQSGAFGAGEWVYQMVPKGIRGGARYDIADALSDEPIGRRIEGYTLLQHGLRVDMGRTMTARIMRITKSDEENRGAGRKTDE